MNRPGDRLRAFAARWCCADTMARIVDPSIADLQHEHARAVLEGRIWRSCAIQIAGWISFVKVMALCAVASLTSLEDWTPDDRKSLARAAVITAVTTVVITVLLVSRSAEDIPKVLVHPSPTRLLFLAPYPFVAGLVLGATLGIALGWGGHALSRRLVAAAVGGALICSALVFVDVGWVAPAAHIAYRSRVGYSDVSTLDVGEVSLGVLHRKIEQVRRESEDAPLGFLAALSFDYHRRVALSFSPLVFTVFALAMAGCLRRRWVLGAAACAAFLAYGWLIMNVVPWSLQPWNLRAPAYVAAWLPNATIAVLTVLLGIIIGLKPSRSV
jgi:hypothetical protein